MSSRTPLKAAALALACPRADGRRGAAAAVVELFTSQGCSSCPPADAILADLARRPDVVALTFPVDYWDYLGWKDTLADPALHRAPARLCACARRPPGLHPADGRERHEVLHRLRPGAGRRADGFGRGASGRRLDERDPRHRPGEDRREPRPDRRRGGLDASGGEVPDRPDRARREQRPHDLVRQCGARDGPGRRVAGRPGQLRRSARNRTGRRGRLCGPAPDAPGDQAGGDSRRRQEPGFRARSRNERTFGTVPGIRSPASPRTRPSGLLTSPGGRPFARAAPPPCAGARA